MLTYINNKFVNSSLKNKVELYFLPLMIIYLLYYFSSSLFVVEKAFVVKNKINLEEYKNKKFQGSFLDFFSNIEDNAKQNNIQILSLNNKKNIVELKIQSPKEKLPLFIKQIENINKFTKITFITMYDKKDSNKYLFDLKIDLNKFYIKRIEKEKIISQKILPKAEEIKTKKIEIAKDNYELKAIIAEYVLVNDIWFKQGEYINGFKVDEIKRNSIVLQNINNDKKIRLELADEEYLENIY